MLDISGDRGVLKDIIREGTGDTVTPDASVLGMEAAAGCSFVLGLSLFLFFLFCFVLFCFLRQGLMQPRLAS
jgi:hypothetical protein